MQVPRRSGDEPGHVEPGDPRAPAGRGARAAEAADVVPGGVPGARAGAPAAHAADGHGGAGEGGGLTALRLLARRAPGVLHPAHWALTGAGELGCSRVCISRATALIAQ